MGHQPLYWTAEAAHALRRGCEILGIPLTEHQEASFASFAEQLLRTNQKFNLTSITDPKDVAVQHFCDSLSPVSVLSVREARSAVDIGTGSGIPGIPLKIVLSAMNIAFVDSTRKKLDFVKRAAGELLLAGCEFYHDRAEDLAHKNLREHFDLALVRAFGTLSEVCEIGLPFLRIGGRLVAYRGREDEPQVRSHEKSIGLLGGTIETIQQFRLPISGHERTLVMITKESTTPGRYPRAWQSIKKSPLRG